MDNATTIDAQLAARVQALRAGRGLSIDGLARASGVSRSMISLIERDECSPTARTLDRLAAALGVPLAALFERATAGVAEPLSRRAGQASWRDPETGYLRRNLSPPGWPSGIVLVESVLPAGARVTYDGRYGAPLDQQVWMLDGVLEVGVPEPAARLEAGDCLAMRVSGPTVFRNPGGDRARYLLAIAGHTQEGGPS